jgi:hypothetical protein
MNNRTREPREPGTRNPRTGNPPGTWELGTAFFIFYVVAFFLLRYLLLFVAAIFFYFTTQVNPELLGPQQQSETRTRRACIVRMTIYLHNCRP